MCGPWRNCARRKGRYRDLEDEERHFFKESLKQFVRYGKENMRRIKKSGWRKGKKTAKKAAATEEEAAEKRIKNGLALCSVRPVFELSMTKFNSLNLISNR